MFYINIVLPGIEEGKLLYTTDGSDKIAKKLQLQGYKTKTVVDTFRARDAFAATFLAGCLENLPLDKSLTLANILGTLIVTVRGNVKAFPPYKK